MKRILFSLFFGLAPFLNPVSAGVISRDWNNPGDGLLTYDDVNRREWLDLPETLLAQYSGGLQTRFNSVLAETGPGGEFAGFTAAMESDVRALAESAGIDISTTSLAINRTAAKGLVDLLGVTIDLSPEEIAGLGYLGDFPQSARIAVSSRSDAAGFFSDTIGLDPSGIPAVTGVWLYRDVVPEPGTTILLVEIFSLLLCWRMRAITTIRDLFTKT